MKNRSTYKVLDIFGNEEVVMVEKTNARPNLFSNYDGFMDKFDVKKTTDDCYTPADVYQVILDYVNEKFDLSDRKIIRPFFPGGDFKNIEYSEECVVIDNPPFSIISKICRFYLDRNILFFLFAPHLTNFSSDIDVTHIVVSADIVYDNGATVKTSFLSNMLGDLKVIGDPELLNKLNKIKNRNKVALPKYVYPENILTVSMVASMVEKGVPIRIMKKDAKHHRGLDSQKKHKKAIFGSGFLLSNVAAAEKLAAEKLAAEKENIIVWKLSENEIKIIESLG